MYSTDVLLTWHVCLATSTSPYKDSVFIFNIPHGVVGVEMAQS